MTVRVPVTVFALGLVLGSAQAGAAIVWNSIDRFIEYGTDQTPRQPGEFPAFYAAKTTASGWAPFNASLGGSFPSDGAWQISSTGPTTLDVVGYANSSGQDFFSLNYHYLGKGESRFLAKFTLDVATPYQLTVSPTNAPLSPVAMFSTSGPTQWFSPNNGATTVYSGTLSPGQWTFNASLQSFGNPYGIDAHLALAVPEPAGVTLLAAVGAAALTRRRCRA